MREFGGMGGVVGGRTVDCADEFEVMVSRVLGTDMSTDDALCREVWCALTNQRWRHAPTGDFAGYTFRSAGDLVAAIRAEGDYMDWYCCGPPGAVTERVRAAFAAEGWHPASPEEYAAALLDEANARSS